MARRALQRLVRAAPGAARFAWGLLPRPVKATLGQLVYPIAAGARGGGQVLEVPPPDVTPGAARRAARRPRVSVIVLTHANRQLCQYCLRSILRNTPLVDLEVIVFDNGSSDGTRDMLAELPAPVVAVRSEENLGFARAVNRALGRAAGEVVVLLNDDTVVMPGWIERLTAHLDSDDRLGLVGPVTNEIGNEAKIDVGYQTLAEAEAFARERAARFAGRSRTTRNLALFCAAARASVLESVGGLDERYEVGMFEDDDLAMTLAQRGLRLAIAEDCFVHHVGQASFSKLGDDAYLRVWEANKRRFEAKWGVAWTPPERGRRD